MNTSDYTMHDIKKIYEISTYERHLYGLDVYEAFWEYLYNNEQKKRLIRRYEEKYGVKPTQRAIDIAIKMHNQT